MRRSYDCADALTMWVAQCQRRNLALIEAAEAIAATVALARNLAERAGREGKAALAARLEAEIQAEEHALSQIIAMLSDDDPHGALEPQRAAENGIRPQ